MARVLFPRPPPSYGVDSFPGELIWVPRSLNPQTSSPQDCIPLCLLQCKGARYLVIYIHSNFEDIGRCHGFCLALRYHLQVHVLVVEYPGYGISPGASCDEQGATESAHVALRFAHEVLRWPWDSILLFGRSIGTGPATQLAAKHRFGGLVLVAPFLSVRELCREYVGAAAGLVWERFPNKELISQVRAPCLFIHGAKDSLIPARHGKELHAACTAHKRLVVPEDMEHNSNLLDCAAYLLQPMREFFNLPGRKAPDMQVPQWAFDKQLSPQFVPPAPSSMMHRRAACSLLGAGCACPGVCRSLGCGGLQAKVVLVEPVKSSSRAAAASSAGSSGGSGVASTAAASSSSASTSAAAAAASAAAARSAGIDPLWVVEEAGGCSDAHVDEGCGGQPGGPEVRGWIEEEEEDEEDPFTERPPAMPYLEPSGKDEEEDEEAQVLPAFVASDPLLGRRMEQLLRRTEELVHPTGLERVLAEAAIPTPVPSGSSSAGGEEPRPLPGCRSRIARQVLSNAFDDSAGRPQVKVSGASLSEGFTPGLPCEVLV